MPQQVSGCDRSKDSNSDENEEDRDHAPSDSAANEAAAHEPVLREHRLLLGEGVDQLLVLRRFSGEGFDQGLPLPTSASCHMRISAMDDSVGVGKLKLPDPRSPMELVPYREDQSLGPALGPVFQAGAFVLDGVCKWGGGGLLGGGGLGGLLGGRGL